MIRINRQSWVDPWSISGVSVSDDGSKVVVHSDMGDLIADRDYGEMGYACAERIATAVADAKRPPDMSPELNALAAAVEESRDEARKVARMLEGKEKADG